MEHTKRVLIVDDEQSMRETLAANLELEDYEVVEATSGLDALGLFQSQHFDVVLSDIQMPQLNGVDALREMKRLRPEVPVVLMTAYAHEAVLREAVDEGAFTIVLKPFGIEEILDVVRRAAAPHLVLVMDDSPEEARALVESLTASGVRAHAAFGAAEGLSLLRAQPIDVLVLALLPDQQETMDMLAEATDAGMPVTVIAMTRSLVPGLMHDMAARGCQTCLRKPVQTHDLLNAISQARRKGAT
ncbi:MAG: response regulator [Polyangiaceae bacterium]